jgi:predicted nucleotidyltransferase
MISETIILEVTARLRQAAPDSTIILFGSHARGAAGDNSDLDILVIEPMVTARRKEMIRLSDALRSLRVPVDVVVTSRKNYAEWSHVPGTIFFNAAQEGKILHAAA